MEEEVKKKLDEEKKRQEEDEFRKMEEKKRKVIKVISPLSDISSVSYSHRWQKSVRRHGHKSWSSYCPWTWTLLPSEI